jgi:hypothetical protein
VGRERRSLRMCVYVKVCISPMVSISGARNNNKSFIQSSFEQPRATTKDIVHHLDCIIDSNNSSLL